MAESEPRLPYENRRQAGRLLAARLGHLRGRPGLVVLALPRGGVAVAHEVALALGAPLDVFVVRKLGYPGHEEYAMGAIASGGVRVMNPLPGTQPSAAQVDRVVEREQRELLRRESLYRGDAPPLAVQGRTVVVVDDGLATGATMRAAAEALRQRHPLYLCVAVPVGTAESCRELRSVADEVVCAAMPKPFRAVGVWFREFPQATDEEVRSLLAEASGR
ncbi:phosphoribosyltransferase [Caenimonas sedimenti]|uniref:Phosphoribosyltransferase n=1 Tax=Caenimonas sedimenti TaxID=2596921 RepID=A0A562ZTC6_9BURK|nr:phosphoribosyltransferase [Caenimonas sedimenti]TWO71860.1 phosphoribosyltransferase [Caenimonas sedimenti]